MASNLTTDWLIRSRRYLAENFREAPDLSAAAGAAGYSPFHYHRLFKELFGETPLEYVTRLRFEEARRLLSRSDMSVSEICLEVGYGSFSTFSLAFARRFGEPPSTHRRIYAFPDLWPKLVIPVCFLGNHGRSFQTSAAGNLSGSHIHGG